jgi:glycosyltransferase involved in cell wall biosynthesis
MHNSLTIVIPNRNRNLQTVQRSLSSIVPQLSDRTRLVIVDYGSPVAYQKELELLLHSFSNVELILCPTQGQLWNKSRCINIVLKSCKTTHLMVSDMDMIWHPHFLENQKKSLSQKESVYFTVGIMTQVESLFDKPFEDYTIKFQTNKEATGISIFPTEHLGFINGFDEFYHGWGSEDTDVHVRLRNAGYEVRFCESQVYFKHQWHEKEYRSRESKLPYHSLLERINHAYFSLNKAAQKVKSNNGQDWGKSCDSIVYKELSEPAHLFDIHATQEDVQAIIHYLKGADNDGVIQIHIKDHPAFKSVKSIIKKAIGKKVPCFILLEKVNEMLLEALIQNHRNCAYHYSFDRQKGLIELSIHLKQDS